MQLILSIDSDPRRSEQLASLVHARLRVDLVQATSAGEGLHALKDRIPDLILTAPLLSPFDDGVLDEYLRDLGAAGAHVQTLRIPVLSAAPKKRALVNRLFVLGRTKPTSAAAPDGCDPKVFAEEIAVYLSRAADARQSIAHLTQAASPRQDEPSPSPVVASPVIADSMVTSEAFIDEFADALEPPPAKAAEPRYVEATEPRYVVATEPPYVVATEPPYDMVNEPTYIATESSLVDEAENSETPVLDTTPDAEQMTRPEPARKTPGTSDTFEAALAAIRAAWVKPDVPATTQPSSATAPAPRPASPGEVDLTNAIDALEDVGGPGRQHSEAVKPQPENRRGLQMGTTARRPIQDEWGIFDADQCGFSAVVDKLDEVAGSKDAPNRTVTTRVISIR